MPEIRRTRVRKDFQVDKQKIADRVTHFFEVDEQSRSVEKDYRLQRNAKFRMWTEGKDWPWADSSDIALPDMMEKSLRTQDTIHNAVMSTRPVISAKAVEGSNKDKERNVDILIDYQVFTEQPGEEFIGELADAFVNDGVSYVFTPWVKESREVADVEIFPPIPTDLFPVEYFRTLLRNRFAGATLTELPGGDGWDWRVQIEEREFTVKFYTLEDGRVEMARREEVVIYDGPRLILKDWDEVLYPARAANLQPPGPSNPHGAAHVILVDYPTVDEIKALAKSGFYDQLTKEQLDRLEVASPSKDDNQENRDQKDTFQGTSGDNAIDRRRAPGHHTVTRLLCFDTMDVDGDGIAEDVVWWVIKDIEALARRKFMSEVFPADPPRRPIRHKSFMPVRGRVAGISLLEMMEGIHDVMKMTFDQTVDAGNLANAPWGFYRPSGSMKPEIIRMSPGELYPLQDPARDVNIPNMPNRDQTFGLNLLTILNAFEERLTTVGDLQLGRVPAGKASALRTVSGMALIAGQGEARPERILRRFFSLLSEVWQDIHGLNHHFLPDEKRVRVIGLQTPGEDPYQTIRKDQVTGHFVFDFKANVLNTSKMALQQSLQALLGTYVSELALQLGIIKPDGIFRLLRQYGFAHGQDPDQFLTPPSPDALRPRIMAEEAISQIMANGIPDGAPAEAGGAIEHLQKLQEFMQSDQLGLLTPEQVQVLRGYIQEVAEAAALQQRQLATLQAAQNFQRGAPNGQGGPPQTAPADEGPPPVQSGELMDETLPGAGGGGAIG